MPTDDGTFFGSAVAIFVIAFLYEALKYYREKLYTDYTQVRLSQLANNRKEGNQELIIPPTNESFV